jgi:hypothetical protein
MTFLGDYYELPYYAECQACGSVMEAADCIICCEADYRDEPLDPAEQEYL